MKRFLLIFGLFIFGLSLNAQLNVNVPNANIPSEVSSEDIKVYPNPVVDYFQVSDIKSLKKIIIYNMFGKEVKSFSYSPNSFYDVADLKSGMYVIRMIDDKNKTIKSLKLNKNYSGV